MTATTELAKIYKANQCTDLNDVEIAISEVMTLIKKYGQKPALNSRWSSLLKRKEKLS